MKKIEENKDMIA